jgi:hypothetical protein
MDKESQTTTKAGSKKPILVIVAVAALGLAALCCLLLVAGILVLRTRTNPPIIPLPQVVPHAPTSTIAPTLPVQPVPVEPASNLDPAAAPLFGSIHLQRGFLPDPFLVDLQAGGIVDTSPIGQACGFTTPAPSFTFRIGGGASDTFLRFFFTASDGTDTTLVVLTPHHEWLCADDSSYGSLVDPVIDFDMAPSGSYFIWAGTKVSGTYAAGKLYITSLESIAP